MDKDLKIAKIVANSTDAYWSQAYNAGKLFAVISLRIENASEDIELNSLGKEVLDNLEAEYFALETKDLESVRKAVLASLEKIPGEIKTSFVVGTIIGNVLYVFAKNGEVLLKRGGRLGSILKGEESLEEASGFLEDKDRIILQTLEFSEIVQTDSFLSSDWEDVSQIAENLAPLVHEKTQGGASGLFLEFTKEENENPEALPLSEPQTENKTAKIPQKEMFKDYFLSLLEKSKQFKKPDFQSPRRTIFLVAIILVLVFLGSIFFALKKQDDEKNQALLSKYYTPSSQAFDEGQSLLDLNKALARDSFMKAQKLLLEGEPKFSKGSPGRKKMDELLGKVNNALSQTANIKMVQPGPVDSSESKLLNSELSSSVQFAAKEDNDIYTLDSGGVSKNGKSLLKKDWDQAGGLGVYFGNVYILDKTSKQILKYVSTGSGYVKTNYFAKDTTPDVSSAKSIAIDGSIWVLLSDGNVLKFTRGASDSLTLSGLDKPFSSPTRIFTSADSEHVYILDNGNSRIVVFDKKGAYQSQYVAPVLKDAKDFEVNEGDKKAFIFSGEKIYKLDL